MYILFKCSMTDPGILPAIRSQNIQKKKNYYIKYMTFEERALSHNEKAADFYSLRKFKLA